VTEIAISTHSLTRDFPSVRAVDSLDLEIPAGVVFGFLGPNGSGKTTTVRLLLGLLEPTSGRAEVLGHDVSLEPQAVRAATGALMEHSGLYERLTAQENLEFFGRAAGMSRVDVKARIQELLDPLDLLERRGEQVGTWSRGMKQKLAVARSLMHRPRVVFLDEPTAGLDPVAAAGLRDDLARLVAEEGVTVFVNTHHLADAERLCHQVGVVRDGRLLAVGRPDELRTATGGRRLEIAGHGLGGDVLSAVRDATGVLEVRLENSRLVLDLDQDVRTPDIVRIVIDRGGEIEEVRRGAETLEEAFMNLLEASDDDI
jgi:ABC-2 type transport system ATP-binding protein